MFQYSIVWWENALKHTRPDEAGRLSGPQSFRFTVTPVAFLTKDLRSLPVCYSWLLSSQKPRQLFFQQSRKSFLNLLCLHPLLSFSPNSQRRPGTKQSAVYQSGTWNVFIYRSSGRPQIKPPAGLSKSRRFGDSLVPGGAALPPRLMAGDGPLGGLQRATWTAAEVWLLAGALICSEEEGSNLELFHPDTQRHVCFFQEVCCNTVH